MDPATEATSARRNLALGVVMLLASGASNQAGAAIGANAFPAIGPAGVVAVRQLVAAAVLAPIVRPPLRAFTRRQWWPVIALAAVFATMNICIYSAIDRIGIAAAITLEFLGPLAVALGGSRTARDLGLALAAAAGVYVLVLPGPSSDVTGIALALVAAACWAAYIVLNRLAGARLPGLQATAAATTLSAAAYVPVALLVLATRGVEPEALGLALLTGLLSSVVPYAADLLTLRRVPAQLFGVLMSVNPVLAALAGIVFLAQVPAAHEVVGIGAIVAVNAAAVSAHARRTMLGGAIAPELGD